MSVESVVQSFQIIKMTSGLHAPVSFTSRVFRISGGASASIPCPFMHPPKTGFILQFEILCGFELLSSPSYSSFNSACYSIFNGVFCNDQLVIFTGSFVACFLMIKTNIATI